MTLGKYVEDAMLLTEVEDGKELNGSRTEEELRADGYVNICLTDKPSDDAVCSWQEISNGYVQVWNAPAMDGEWDADSGMEG